jgi:hypothetical protein
MLSHDDSHTGTEAVALFPLSLRNIAQAAKRKFIAMESLATVFYTNIALHTKARIQHITILSSELVAILLCGASAGEAQD